jgi:hypothetical protein
MCGIANRKVREQNEKLMKKKTELNDELRPEYDLKSLLSWAILDQEIRV